MARGDEQLGRVGRRALVGAVVGAVLGALLGLVLHVILSRRGSAVTYEIVGAGLGLLVGIILGAFYGGAWALPWHRGRA
jgi:hypothetical protein